jgi:hypothetical protein
VFLVAGLATVGMLFTAQAGLASIVPQKGIADVELGMTTQEVRGVLGPPDRYVTVQEDAFITYRRWIYDWHKLRVGVIGATGAMLTVLNVTTRSPEEQTARGARVGITETSLRQRHPRVECSSYHRVRTCALGDPAGRQTGFVIRSGRVERIFVADVFEAHEDEELGEWLPQGEDLPQVQPFTPPQVAADAPRLANLRVSNGGSRFSGDRSLLATVSPNRDGFRDRAVIRFTLDRSATVQAAAYLTGSSLKKKVWGTKSFFGPGRHRLVWRPGTFLPPRNYLVRLRATNSTGSTRVYGWNKPYFTGFAQGPVVRIQGVDAGFTRPGYGPGATGWLRVSTDARTLTLQIFRAGPELEPTRGNDSMNGVPVTAPRSIDWRGKRSAPHAIAVAIGHRPSGLYYARLTTGDGRVGFAPYVQRPGTPGKNPVAVVLPTNTWQAYNFRDSAGDGWGDTWYVTARIRTIDLTRAFLDRGVPSHFRSTDLSFLRWLYRTGKGVDFLSDADFQRIPDAGRLASRYRLIVFPGHEEYVTGHAYDLAEGYRDRGGNLAFLSANNFFRRVDRSGNTLHLIDLWRRLGRPEASLVGVQYLACCNGFPFGPYVVRGNAEAPWLFSGTGLSNGDPFGNGGIEIDARGSSSPRSIVVLANIPDLYGPGRSAEMTMYRNDAGASVFASGSLNFGGSAQNPLTSALLENLWRRLTAP